MIELAALPPMQCGLARLGYGFAAGCEAGLRPAVELKIGMGYALGLNRGGIAPLYEYLAGEA